MDIQVAGVYITENHATCIIGVLDKRANGFSPKSKRIITKNNVITFPNQIPRTYNDKNDKKRKRLQKTFGRLPDNSKTGKKSTPEKLLERCIRWLIQRASNLQSVSIACFGPFHSLQFEDMTLDENTPYGKLSDTPAYADWEGIPLFWIFHKGLEQANINAKVRVYTDVDAVAFGEYIYMADRYFPRSRGSRVINPEQARFWREYSVVFLKFSRAINGGIASQGSIWRGRLHPLMSVVRPRRYAEYRNGKMVLDDFEGCCKYHGDCLEGLIGLTALEQRKGVKSHKEISFDDTELWDKVAYYIAELCISTTALLAPSRIVIGGRAVNEVNNYEEAEKLLKSVRGYFYRHVADDITSPSPNFSPNFEELRNTAEYISLPIRTRDHEGKLRKPMAGTHGVLRLAANEIVNN